MTTSLRDELGRSPLHYAALEGATAQVEELVLGGAEVNLQDLDGWTPLHFAAQEQHAEVVRVLIRAGAAIDVADQQGNTPLSTAVFNSHGRGEVIQALRAAGADPTIENLHGQSALGLARLISNYDVKQFFSDVR